MFKKTKAKESTPTESTPTVELTTITNGRKLEDLNKVLSTRNCQVYEINKDLYFTLINKGLRGNLEDVKKQATLMALIEQY